MGQVTVIVSGFTGHFQGFNGNHTLNITNTDIARGIITIGKTHWLQYFKNPMEILNDLVHHFTGLSTFVTTTNGQLCITARFRNLDASDQRIKSYNIGMGIAKIVADKVLNIPYLQHVDYLIDEGIATITAGSKQRGDLAGKDLLGNWHILEAKGSSYSFSDYQLRGAKQQATRVISIDGSAPNTSSYCCTTINESDTTIYLADPDDDNINPIRLTIDSDKFLLSYYNKLYSKFATTEEVDIDIGYPQIENYRPIYYRLTETFVVGMLSSIIENLRGNSVRFLDTISAFSEVAKTFESNYISIGGDGIILIEENLR